MEEIAAAQEYQVRTVSAWLVDGVAKVGRAVFKAVGEKIQVKIPELGYELEKRNNQVQG